MNISCFWAKNFRQCCQNCVLHFKGYILRNFFWKKCNFIKSFVFWAESFGDGRPNFIVRVHRKILRRNNSSEKIMLFHHFRKLSKKFSAASTNCFLRVEVKFFFGLSGKFFRQGCQNLSPCPDEHFKVFNFFFKRACTLVENVNAIGKHWERRNHLCRWFSSHIINNMAENKKAERNFITSATNNSQKVNTSVLTFL